MWIWRHFFQVYVLQQQVTGRSFLDRNWGPTKDKKKLWKMKLKCIFFLILLLATICQCDEHDHIVSKFEFFTFVVKGWVISKGISNLVPSSKNPKTNQCSSTFYFWLKRWGSVFWVLFLWEFLKGGLHVLCRITVLVTYFYFLYHFGSQ